MITKKILMVLSILFGLMMVNAGLNKFFNYMSVEEGMPDEAIEIMVNFAKTGWLLPLTGIIEILAGILFAIPRFRALGAVMILPVMIGIVLFNLVIVPTNAPIALILFAINGWAIWADREKFLPLIRSKNQTATVKTA